MPGRMHVTPKTRPDLKWKKSPKGFYVADELIRSDAFRSLTKIETDIFLFSLTERRYPSFRKNKKSGRRDYWNPLNGREFKLSYKAIERHFSNRGFPVPSISTITRAFRKFMAVGFLSLPQSGSGGAGRGDLNIYRLEHNWRLWKKGDAACFKIDGMAIGKGFCQPGSGKFYVKKS